MDLTLSADQQHLRAALRESLGRVWTPQRLRDAADMPEFDTGAWGTLAELGVFGLTTGEAEGGMGLGLADAAILYEELGRSLVPGSVVATLLAARVLPDAAAGKAIVAAADTRDRHAFVATPNTGERGVRAIVADSGDRRVTIEHFGAATHLVVADDAGLWLAGAAEYTGTAVEHPLDPLTPLWQVELSGARGERIGGPAEAARWRAEGAVLTSSLQVGVAQGALDLAVRYAGERVQFGRVIGSFQAVKHLLAESLVRVDLARAATLVAALEADEGDADPAAAISAAKTLADRAANENGRCGIQVHGGMGFTWEVLAHLYVKRAWVLSTSYGSVDEHTLHLADALSAATRA